MKKVALNFSKTQSKIKHRIKKIARTKSQITIDKNKEYHIINLDPQGWVIVSKDDIATPILAYSLTGSIGNERSLAPAFKSWMKGINAEIVKAKEAHIDNDTYIDEWDNLTAEAEVFDANQVARSKSPKAKREKGPLLVNINWNQDYPYNMLTPADSRATGSYRGHTPVGCVATAIAQIMAYHKWPKKFTYNGLVSDITYFNWSNMSDYDYAKISYKLGSSMGMSYGPYGSGTSEGAPIRPLNVYYRYKTGLSEHKSTKSMTYWHNKIKDNIDKHLPIYYTGGDFNNVDLAHAFVLDGYSYTNGSKFYHFNLGWGGKETAWYALDAISKSYDLSSHQTAIFDIKPKQELLLAPSNFKATKLSSTSVILKWTDNAIGEGVFQLNKKDYESSTAYVDSYRRIAYLPANTTTYKIDGLEPDTTYTYAIEAHAKGDLQYSNLGKSTPRIFITFKTKKTSVAAWLIPAVYYPCLF